MLFRSEHARKYGNLSDKAWYLAQEAVMDILDYSYECPWRVWLYKRPDGSIGHAFSKEDVQGEELSPEDGLHGSCGVLSKDRRFILPGAVDEVKRFLMDLGLEEKEAGEIVCRWSQDNRPAQAAGKDARSAANGVMQMSEWQGVDKGRVGKYSW